MGGVRELEGTGRAAVVPHINASNSFTLYHFVVMGDKRKREKIHENVHALCFHENFKHESTANIHVHVSMYLLPTFTPPLHHNIMVKGLLYTTTSAVRPEP